MMITNEHTRKVEELLKSHGALSEADSRQVDAVMLHFDINLADARRLITATRNRVTARSRLQEERSR